MWNFTSIRKARERSAKACLQIMARNRWTRFGFDNAAFTGIGVLSWFLWNFWIPIRHHTMPQDDKPQISQNLMGGIWTTEMLREQLPTIVDQYDEECVKGCCYELKVGGEIFVSGKPTKKRLIKEGEGIFIPPGQLALIITKEYIKSPKNALGLLSFKSSLKLSGLINVSGFHIDPGFEGKLIFSVYNAGPQNIFLSAGTPLFMMWFCSLADGKEAKYDGVHNKQTHLSDAMVSRIATRIPSPHTLEKELQELKHSFRRLKYIAVAIFGALLSYIISQIHINRNEFLPTTVGITPAVTTSTSVPPSEAPAPTTTPLPIATLSPTATPLTRTTH